MATSSIALPPLPFLRPDISRRSRPPTASRPLLRSDIPRRPSGPPTASSRPRATPRATPEDARRNGHDPKTIPVRCSCGDHRCPGPSTPPRTTNRHGKPSPASSRGAVAAAVITGERSRQALDSREVAVCLLRRIWDAAPAPRKEGRPVLRCVCHELALGSRCALHQDAPGRSWMERQEGGVPIAGGGGKVVVPKVRAGDSTQVVAEYLRWRRSVRLPSRFYMEHVRMINAGHEY